MTTLEFTPIVNKIFMAYASDGDKYQGVFLNELTPAYVKMINLKTMKTFQSYLHKDGKLQVDGIEKIISRIEIHQPPSVPLNIAPGKTYLVRDTGGKIINQFVCGDIPNQITLVLPVEQSTTKIFDPATRCFFNAVTLGTTFCKKDPCVIGIVTIEEAFVRASGRQYTAILSKRSGIKEHIGFVCVSNNTPTEIVLTSGVSAFIDDKLEIYTSKELVYDYGMSHYSAARFSKKKFVPNEKFGTLSQIYVNMPDGHNMILLDSASSTIHHVTAEMLQCETPTPLKITNNGVPEKVLMQIGIELHVPKENKFTTPDGKTEIVYECTLGSDSPTKKYTIVASW